MERKTRIINKVMTTSLSQILKPQMLKTRALQLSQKMRMNKLNRRILMITKSKTIASLVMVQTKMNAKLEKKTNQA